MLDHRHIMVTATGLTRPPKEATEVVEWLRRLVAAVDMTILIGPHAIRCETVGNEGCTGIVCIETSHASIHVWDTGVEPFLKMDLYSCMPFAAETVLDLVREFGPARTEHMVVDRNAGMKVVEQSAAVPPAPVGRCRAVREAVLGLLRRLLRL